MSATFSAFIVISDQEQPDRELLDQSEPLRTLPTMYPGERQLPAGDGLPPPSHKLTVQEKDMTTGPTYLDEALQDEVAQILLNSGLIGDCFAGVKPDMSGAHLPSRFWADQYPENNRDLTEEEYDRLLMETNSNA